MRVLRIFGSQVASTPSSGALAAVPSAGWDSCVGLVSRRERGPPPHRDTGARERARGSLDRRFAARSLVTSVVSAALARKMADVRHRGSVLRRLILALPEIRAPERALAPPAREGLRNARNPAQMSDLGAPNPRDARNRKRRRGRRKWKIRPISAPAAPRAARESSAVAKSPQQGPGRGKTPISRSREQKAEKPTPQRTGKPSRAGGATSPRQQ